MKRGKPKPNLCSIISKKFLLPVILTLLSLHMTFACKLKAYESGQCVSSASISTDMPFCSEVVGASICIPKHQEYFPFNQSVKIKDQYVQSIYIRQTEVKLVEEIKNSSNSVCHICWDLSCKLKYKKFLCTFNFPDCDENLLTKQICASLCTQFTTACGYNSDLCVSKYAELLGDFNSTC